MVSEGHFLDAPAKTEKGRLELEVFVPYSNFSASVLANIINSKGVSFIRLSDLFSELVVSLWSI